MSAPGGSRCRLAEAGRAVKPVRARGDAGNNGVAARVVVYIANVSAISIEPPDVRIGQDLASFTAASRLEASTML